jgi:FkbM family methyltransferase
MVQRIRVLVIALVAGWATALWLAYRLLLARGRLLLHEAHPQSPLQPHTADLSGWEGQSAQEIVLAESDLRLGRKHEYLLRCLTDMRQLKDSGARFLQDENDRLLCEIEGITVLVRSADEMWILREIFVDGIYDITVNGPAVIWDVGMNVGIASLYFASRGNARVVGYEPIAPTYEMALENLALNPSLRDSITAINSGIGGSNRTEIVDYCDELKGSVGLLGAVADPFLRHSVLNLPANASIRREMLRMEDAVSVLTSIRSAHPHLPIIAKMDCEGAEYEVIDALHRSGDLPSLAALIIEWHRDGPEPLQRHLVEAGFTVFLLGGKGGHWGRLYAVRQDAEPRRSGPEGPRGGHY